MGARVEPSKGVGRGVADRTRRTDRAVTRCIGVGLCVLIAAAHASAQSPSQRTYANPIDIDYKYNFEQHNEGISYRSGADPVIVVQRGEYYLADRSNKGIDVIDTHSLQFKRTITGTTPGFHFVGIVLNGAGTAVDNNHSGQDGVVSHGRWLYAGDGDSTLKVIDLDAPNASAIKQSIST